jgi:hypothetical protein
MKGVLTALCGLLLSACSSHGLNRAMEQAYEDVDRGGFVSGVDVFDTARGRKVMSGIRTWGHDPIVLRDHQVFVLYGRDTRWGRLQFEGPARNRERLMNRQTSLRVGAGDFAKLSTIAIEILGDAIGSMDALADRHVVVSFFVPGDSRAYNDVKRSDAEDGPIRIVVTTPSVAPFGQGQWWPNMTSTAIHELTHVNHGLRGIEPEGHAAEANFEAAGELAEMCALYRFMERVLEEYEIDAHAGERFEEPAWIAEAGTVYPRWANGDLTPDRDSLDELTASPTAQANLIGNAIFWHYIERLRTAEDRSQPLAEFRALCRRSANSVPDFINGDF